METLHDWLVLYCRAVREAFGDRICCIGIQGSRGRGEGGPESDIDMVLILDRAAAADLLAYRAAVEPLPRRELLCGFVSGEAELLAWNPGELFQFYHDTRPLQGDLEFLRPLAGREAAAAAVRDGACALYHGCAHNLVHARSREALAALCKSVGFTLRAKCFLETGRYLARGEDLPAALTGEDRTVWETACFLKTSPELTGPEFDRFSGILAEWACGVLHSCASRKDPV